MSLYKKVATIVLAGILPSCVAFSDSDFTINVDGKEIRHRINNDINCDPSREMWVKQDKKREYFLGSPFDTKLRFYSLSDGVNYSSNGSGTVNCGWYKGDGSINELNQQSYQINLDLVLKNLLN